MLEWFSITYFIDHSLIEAIVEAALEGQNGTVMMCHAQGVLQMVRTTSHPKLRVHDSVAIRMTNDQ